LERDPLIALDKLEADSITHGFYGLSYRDQITILDYQIMYLTTLKDYYVTKISKTEIQAKVNKMRTKVQKIEDFLEKRNKILNNVKLISRICFLK